jgi:UPF0176 protein
MNVQKFMNVQNQIVVATFYKFVCLNNLPALQVQIKDYMLQNEVRGTVLLATEGINSTLSGKRDSLDSLINFLRSDLRFSDLQFKETYSDRLPFKRIKVKIKKEIISMGVSVDPCKLVGQYVAPANWNKIISDPEVMVIDTRNQYEVEIGCFKGAIDPKTDTFKDIPKFTKEYLQKYKPKKVAMYCTGGIRCEKYSSYMLEQGLEEVYHLQGGILKYLEEIPEEQSLWKGECFVFDERRSVGHKVFQK